ncbi:MAG TPA: PqqD family protein [Elusimicrobiota bacterium]|nr:PqqD family protein [Elusimicrobiota bacterium]
MKKETFKVATHIAWRRVEEEIVALDLDSSLYYSFNDTGARIWELLAEGAPLEKTVVSVAEEFEAAPAVIEKDAREFVRDLRKEKLLEPA